MTIITKKCKWGTEKVLLAIEDADRDVVKPDTLKISCNTSELFWAPSSSAS
jgi:hypothetical protein